MPVALIERFEVLPESDEAFLADWRRERGRHGATLYRAIRDDTPVRFVSIAAASEGADLYEPEHEDGTPEGPDGIVQITAFAVPPAADAAFLPAWHHLRDVLSTRRGYLGTRLYRSAGAASPRFIAITRWSSPLMVFRTEQQPEFRAATADLPFPSESALYTRTNNALRDVEGAI